MCYNVSLPLVNNWNTGSFHSSLVGAQSVKFYLILVLLVKVLCIVNGPELYTVLNSDQSLCTDNVLFKYADDTTLLVPEHTSVDIVA